MNVPTPTQSPEPATSPSTSLEDYLRLAFKRTASTTIASTPKPAKTTQPPIIVTPSTPPGAPGAPGAQVASKGERTASTAIASAPKPAKTTVPTSIAVFANVASGKQTDADNESNANASHPGAISAACRLLKGVGVPSKWWESLLSASSNVSHASSAAAETPNLNAHPLDLSLLSPVNMMDRTTRSDTHGLSESNFLQSKRKRGVLVERAKALFGEQQGDPTTAAEPTATPGGSSTTVTPSSLFPGGLDGFAAGAEPTTVTPSSLFPGGLDELAAGAEPTTVTPSRLFPGEQQGDPTTAAEPTATPGGLDELPATDAGAHHGQGKCTESAGLVASAHGKGKCTASAERIASPVTPSTPPGAPAESTCDPSIAMSPPQPPAGGEGSQRPDSPPPSPGPSTAPALPAARPSPPNRKPSPKQVLVVCGALSLVILFLSFCECMLPRQTYEISLDVNCVDYPPGAHIFCTMQTNSDTLFGVGDIEHDQEVVCGERTQTTSFLPSRPSRIRLLRCHGVWGSADTKMESLTRSLLKQEGEDYYRGRVDVYRTSPRTKKTGAGHLRTFFHIVEVLQLVSLAKDNFFSGMLPAPWWFHQVLYLAQVAFSQTDTSRFPAISCTLPLLLCWGNGESYVNGSPYMLAWAAQTYFLEDTPTSRDDASRIQNWFYGQLLICITLYHDSKWRMPKVITWGIVYLFLARVLFALWQIFFHPVLTILQVLLPTVALHIIGWGDGI